ncbi:MAG: FKBP-type peptidyl-prolyl cis-trans isomerase [Prevotella sp.]|nr:FKBP-type peptidyl-prolyl cis-trans isomerase [Prevotella sp.]
MIALALLASASFSTVSAGKKKDKKAEQTPVVQPVQLKNGSDTLSYLAGMYMTEGLIPYIQQQGVDTAYMAEFVDGFKKAISDMTPQQKAHIMGMQIASQVRDGMLPRMKKEFTETPDSLIDEVLFRGFVDAITNDTTVITQKKAVDAFREKQTWNKNEKEERLYGPNREAGRHYLDSLKADTSIIRTESGLMYKVLTQGEGEVPQKTDKVLVNYEGRLVDGTVFDASAKHGDKPATFRADQVISGWTEALTMMPVGSKWQLYIPYELAYGNRNMGNIKPFSTLIFDVELVGIDKPKAEQAEGEKAETKQSVKKSVGKKTSKK